DKWVLAEYQQTMSHVEAAWTNLDIYTATQALKTFGTGLLPSHYLEMVKSRLYDEDKAAAWTLHRMVRDFLAAFSPVCPFFAHHISSTVYGASAVDVDAFPDSPLPEVAHGTDEGARLCGLSTSLQDFNGQTWAAKKEQGISLNQPIEGIRVPTELTEFGATLTRMHQLS
ncbi:MAG: class I tRNA ligase family protein, partial [Poseidonia sp.]